MVKQEHNHMFRFATLSFINLIVKVHSETHFWWNNPLILTFV